MKERWAQQVRRVWEEGSIPLEKAPSLDLDVLGRACTRLTFNWRIYISFVAMHGYLIPYCSSNLVNSSPNVPPILRLLSKKPHVWLELSLIRQHSPNSNNIFSSCNWKIKMEQWESESPMWSKLTIEVHFYRNILLYAYMQKSS